MSFTDMEVVLVHQNRLLTRDYQAAVAAFSDNLSAASVTAARNAEIARRNAVAARSAARKASELSAVVDQLSVENAELRSALSRAVEERDQTLLQLSELLDLIEA